MKRLVFVFLIIFTIYIINYFFFKKKLDRFVPISNNMTNIRDSYGKLITRNINPYRLKNCCLVTKVYNKNKDEFEYNYKKLDSCDYNMLKDNHSHLFVQGISGWNNNKCKKPDIINDTDILGSCRNINFECKDFMTNKECAKFNMEWTDKTCYTKYQKPFRVEEYNISTN